MAYPFNSASSRLREDSQASPPGEQPFSLHIGPLVLTATTPSTHASILVVAIMASGLLPGQSAPIGVITSTDRSPVVLIATGIALVVGIVSLAIRVYVRFTHTFAWDDYTIFVASVSSVPILIKTLD